jgi:hypothetical protein
MTIQNSGSPSSAARRHIALRVVMWDFIVREGREDESFSGFSGNAECDDSSVKNNEGPENVECRKNDECRMQNDGRMTNVECRMTKSGRPS